MTQTEFLLDTLKYYCEDTSRRCVKEGICNYHPSTLGLTNSEGCAIGRYLPEELALKFDSNGVVGVENIFENLPENLRLLTLDFLVDIQCLHNINNHWNTDTEGLSVKGKDDLVTIIEQYGLDKNLFVDYLN